MLYSIRRDYTFKRRVARAETNVFDRSEMGFPSSRTPEAGETPATTSSGLGPILKRPHNCLTEVAAGVSPAFLTNVLLSKYSVS